MKKFLLAICVCLAVVTLVSSAFAEELWDWHLRGVDEGLASGMLPPAGLYFINDFYGLDNWHGYGPGFGATGNGNANSSIHLSGWVDVPVMLWVPGNKFLGATYAAAIAEPFDFTNLNIQTVNTGLPDGGNSFAGGRYTGAYNTVLVPFILSWKLPSHFFVAASFAVGLNDGSASPGDGQAGITRVSSHPNVLGRDGGLYAFPSNDFYTFTPDVGVTWLYHGWNLSAEFEYTFATIDGDTNYQSANEFAGDYSLSYTWGRWTFGLGAEDEQQTGNDEFNAGTGYKTQANTLATNVTAGPLVGYNFGPFSLMFIYNFPVTANNDVGGSWWDARIVIPLGNPNSWWQ